MTIMGQPSPIRRLVGRPWNLYVRRFLKMPKRVDFLLRFPEMVFLGEFARVRVFRIIRRKWKPRIISEGSATPITILQIKNGMSSEQQVNNAKTNLFEQKHGSGFDSRRLPHFIIRKKK